MVSSVVIASEALHRVAFRAERGNLISYPSFLEIASVETNLAMTIPLQLFRRIFLIENEFRNLFSLPDDPFGSRVPERGHRHHFNILRKP